MEKYYWVDKERLVSTKGYYYEPTIFDNIKDNFTIMKEEPFGPLVPILTFKILMK